MVWKADDPQGNESGKIKYDIVQYTRGLGLDLGCGQYKTYPHFIGVDNGNHAQFGWNIKPDVFVESCEKLDVFASQSMDFVFSSHLLEHIHDFKGALKEWWRVIKTGGYLVLYLPHKEFYPNIGQPGANPDHKHDFYPQDIIDVMSDLKGFDLVENEERNEGYEYSFFQVYKKINSQKCIFSYKNPKPSKTAAVVRYGAFGDMLQVSSVCAGLKEKGYHVTVYSSNPGASVITNDPNIDKIILQDKDQVPNNELGNFWANISKKYDKFVNLSESVEGTFLALPGRVQHQWPKNLRHAMLNKNYMDHMHDIAEIPHGNKVRFYPTEEEKTWARKQRSKMGDFVVLWSLAGSSVHKTWAGVDTILARIILEHPNSTVVLCGGPECVILEGGWEEEKRVIRTSGKWSIRETLSFAEQADLVIGPETGVLNSVSMRPMAKIVFLSHSSHENFSRDWINTWAMEPQGTECYPCHQLHYDWSHCKRDESGTAKCQVDIPVEYVWDAVKQVAEQTLEKVA